MAAALLAALFAMGVFAPAGVDAGVLVGDKKPTIKFVDSDGNALGPGETGSLVIEFEVDDTVDGKREATGGGSTSEDWNDTVYIKVSQALFFKDGVVADDATKNTSSAFPGVNGVTVTQDGAPVGTAWVYGNDGATANVFDGTGEDLAIAIIMGADGRGNLVAGKRAKVTVSGLTVGEASTVAADTGATPPVAEERDDRTKAMFTSGAVSIWQQSVAPATTPIPEKASVNTADAPADGDRVNPYAETVAVYDDTKTFTDAKAYWENGDLKVEFTARRAQSAQGNHDVSIELSSEHFTGDPVVTIAPSDAAISDGTGLSELVTVYEAKKYTVTYKSLGTLRGADAGDEVTLKQGNGGGGTPANAFYFFERKLTIGGDTQTGADADVATDDKSADVFGTTATKPNNKADTGVKVMLDGLNASTPIPGNRDIVITLPNFQIPDSIALSEIIVEEMADSAEDTTATGTFVDFYGSPETISVSGSGKTRKITITLPRREEQSDGTGTQNVSVTGAYSILIKKSAGVKTPNLDGKRTIVVQDLDTGTDVNHEFPVTIVNHVAADPKWVVRGGTVELTAKGVNAPGDVTAHLYSGALEVADLDNLDLVQAPVVGRAARSDGTAVITIDTTSSIFLRGAIDATEDPAADAKGVNEIVLVDAAGAVIGKTQAHTRIGILPSVELDVTEVRRSGKVEVSVSDWYYGTHISLVRINGITVDLPDNTNTPDDADDLPDPWHTLRDDGEILTHTEGVDSDGEAEFEVVVDRDTRLGEMQVELHGANIASDNEVIASLVKQGSATSPDIHKQTVQVGFFPLTITPSNEDGDGMAVTEQVIQIEGEEFLDRTCITIIRVGERSIMEATNGDTVRTDARDDCVDTDSNGNLTATFRVPRGLEPGRYPVVVRDEGNRVGQGWLVVPEPMITLDPERSQRGTTVTVVGKNFPADDVVTIDYRGVTVEATSTDTVGNFRATFQVPISAPIGATHEVIAASENKADGLPDAPQNQEEVILTATAEHRVSDEILELSPDQVAPGQQLTINASNLPLFTPVTISIAGRAVAGKALGQDDASDGFGRYVDDVLVPQVPAGITIVELTVHTERGADVRVAEFVEITNIITRPTDEVFADLIAAGQLSSVWRYSIDETGSDWDSFDPQFVGQPGINDLELVSTGDIVWIHVTESVAFQGRSLIAGWNLISLE